MALIVDDDKNIENDTNHFSLLNILNWSILISIYNICEIAFTI